MPLYEEYFQFEIGIPRSFNRIKSEYDEELKRQVDFADLEDGHEISLKRFVS